MRQRVADYIAGRLAEAGVNDCFMITGGGAMHLNDAFGHHEGMRCTFFHHEQACAIAAEGYARVSGKPALVCVTSGPGGTNALTGVMGAWLDSIPMIVISGQVKRETTIAACPDLSLRQLGDQEFDIVHSVANMTKYAVMVTEPHEIAWHLDKALRLTTSGRMGPVWIDVPLDVQSAVIDTDDLPRYEEAAAARNASNSSGGGSIVGSSKGAGNINDLSIINNINISSIVTADLGARRARTPEISDEQASEVLRHIKEAKRPLVLAGTGVRLAGAEDMLSDLLDILRIPAAVAWNANDLVPYDSPWYAGMPGTVGTKAGNFALQNADLILSLGCRMNIRMTGYTKGNFGKRAYKIAVDIDEAELHKPTVDIDLPVHGDVKEFIFKLMKLAERGAAAAEAERNTEAVSETEGAVSDPGAGDRDSAPARAIEKSRVHKEEHAEWLALCRAKAAAWPAVLPEYRRSGSEDDGLINPYVFLDMLFDVLDAGDHIVCSNGSACVMTFQAAKIKKGQRMFTNSGCASMGYGLPAAIGAQIALNETLNENGRVICIEGDGSIMMNLQELATSAYYTPGLRIIVLNNNGYHSIRQTQSNFFGEPYVGIDRSSGVALPEFEKLAYAFDMEYFRICTETECRGTLEGFLSGTGPALCEVVVDPEQPFAPKLSSRKTEDGRVVSASLDDMYC